MCTYVHAHDLILFDLVFSYTLINNIELKYILQNSYLIKYPISHSVSIIFYLHTNTYKLKKLANHNWHNLYTFIYST